MDEKKISDLSKILDIYLCLSLIIQFETCIIHILNYHLFYVLNLQSKNVICTLVI